MTTPRLLGVYAVEWAPTAFADEVLGALGGVLYGTVMDYRADREFLVAEVYWIPPESEPIGPMALHVSCTPAPGVRPPACACCRPAATNRRAGSATTT